jgi:hypothetical protein
MEKGNIITRNMFNHEKFIRFYEKKVKWILKMSWSLFILRKKGKKNHASLKGKGSRREKKNIRNDNKVKEKKWAILKNIIMAPSISHIVFSGFIIFFFLLTYFLLDLKKKAYKLKAQQRKNNSPIRNENRFHLRLMQE